MLAHPPALAIAGMAGLTVLLTGGEGGSQAGGQASAAASPVAVSADPRQRCGSRRRGRRQRPRQHGRFACRGCHAGVFGLRPEGQPARHRTGGIPLDRPEQGAGALVA